MTLPSVRYRIRAKRYVFEILDDPMLPDAILDCVVHNAYHLDLSGESIPKHKSLRGKSAKNGVTPDQGSIEIDVPGASSGNTWL